MRVQRTEVAGEALKGMPPISVATAALYGVSLSDLVVILTIIYVALQIGYLLYRWRRLAKTPVGAVVDE